MGRVKVILREQVRRSKILGFQNGVQDRPKENWKNCDFKQTWASKIHDHVT